MIYVGHVLAELAKLDAESVSCVCTSPPYWSLRKYDAPDAVWGDHEYPSQWCPHPFGFEEKAIKGEGYTGTSRWQHQDHEGRVDQGITRSSRPDAWTTEIATHDTCPSCGAWKGQLGLEPTPELFVEHTLEWLRAVKRVLRKDGVCWLNIGDGYAGGHTSYAGAKWQHGVDTSAHTMMGKLSGDGLKPKDLVLMPERIALAVQADGWWVRKRIVWSKPNAMPESCTDRPTSAHETIWMLTRSKNYWYDQEAVRETADYGYSPTVRGEFAASIGGKHGSHTVTPGNGTGGRNMRDVWTFPTAQTPEAHFATFPEELPRRCIEASCPKEVCATCGHARERIVEPANAEYAARLASANDRGDWYARVDTVAKREDGTKHGKLEGGITAEYTTTGWTSCECADYQPGIVLDPFLGIGTTGVVARRLGREFVGIELSDKYAAIAERKIALALHDVAPAKEHDKLQLSFLERP